GRQGIEADMSDEVFESGGYEKLHEETEDYRRKSAAPAGEHPEDAAKPGARLDREPFGLDPGHGRISASLADAKHKAIEKQRHVTGGRAGKSGEDRPGDDDSREGFFCPIAVGQPAAGNLEEGIGEPEGA